MRTIRRRLLTVVVLAAAAAAGGCGGTGHGSTARPSPGAGAALTTRQLERGADHACVVGPGRPRVDWSAARNPVLADPSAAVKDEAAVWTGGRWHLLVSYATVAPSVPGGVRWDIATATSPDLVHWSAFTRWPAQAGVDGVASPDVVREPDGRFVVTYQSDPGEPGPPTRQDRLYYRTSPDLVHWSAPRPLAQGLAPAPDDRMIDGALVYTGHQLLLGFKFRSSTQPDVFELARSTSGTPAGPWVLVGRPDIDVDGGTVENYEFVWVSGAWRLVATSDNLDQPWMFTLAGDPATPGGWLRWRGATMLSIPAEGWNTGPGISSIGFEHADSVFLCDDPGADGDVYAFYAGSTELTAFGGWGHTAIGVARGTDLVHWRVPPG